MSTEAIAPPARGAAASASPLRALAGGAFAFSLAVAAFAMGLGSGIRGTDLSLYGLAIVTLVVGFLPVIVDAGRPPERRHVLISLVGIVYGLAFSIPVFDYYMPAVGPVDPPGMSNIGLEEADILHAQILGLAGLLLLYAGHALPVDRLVSRLVPAPRYEWTERGALTAAGILIPFGWVLYIAGRLGLVPAQLGSGFVGGFMDLALIAPALLALTFLRYRSRLSLVLLLVLVPLTSGFNMIPGSKRLVLLPWAMLGFAYIVYTRRVQMRWLVLGFTALAVLYPAASFYRDVVLVGNTRTMSDVLQNPGAALQRVVGFVGGRSFADYLSEGVERSAARLDAVGHPAVIIRDTPDVVPFQDGRTLGYLVLSYIPRIVWPGKPVMVIGQWLNDVYNNATIMVQSHLGPSWIGEFYLNFGTPGVLIGMLWLGAVFRFWRELCGGRQRTIPLMLAEIVVLHEVLIHITGGLITIVNGPVNGVIPLLGIHLLVRLFGAVQPVDQAAGQPPA